jgi:predicted DNA-binding transcriptional regulator AlpA
MKQSSIPESLENFDQLPNSAYVRLPVVKGLFAYSKSTVYRNIKKGRIPPQKDISDGGVGWNVGELRQALAAIN